MSELVPLLSSSADDFELALLRSTEKDDLGAEGLLKTAAVLGLGASLVLPVVTASPIAASTSPVPLWPIVVKWLGLGAFCGATLSGAAVVIGSPPHSVAAVSTSRAATSPAARAESAPVAVGPDESPPGREPTARGTSRSANQETRLMPLESHNGQGLYGSSAASSSVAAFAPLVEAGVPGEANSIAEQIQAIELARQALGASRPAEALRAIEGYRARWPSGTLTPESIVLGVRAKKMLGDEAGAAREARAFIALYPKSRYAAQLRALFGMTRAE